MSHDAWEEDGILNRWEMPKQTWFFKLPIIRHVRSVWLLVAVQLWYSIGPGSYYGIRTGYDRWVLYGIWHGLEK